MHPQRQRKAGNAENALTSYADLIADENQKWPYAAMVTDVMKKFDPPDVYAALSAKGLKYPEPWGAQEGMKA